MTYLEDPQHSLEAQTHALFSSPSTEVVHRIAAHIYESSEQGVGFSEGSARILVVPTSEGERRLSILVAEAYLESEAPQLWKGKRLDAIRALEPGEMIAFRHRTSVLSFIKTQGGDNILLRSLQDLETRDLYGTPTAISTLLGMEPYNEGRLMLNSSGELQFTKVSF